MIGYVTRPALIDIAPLAVSHLSSGKCAEADMRTQLVSKGLSCVMSASINMLY